MKDLFELRGQLDKKTNLIISFIGFVFIMTFWIMITSLKLIPEQLLPSPFKVISSFPELHFKNSLVRNLGYSVFLNMSGYIEAVIVSLIVGFFMGLFPLFRGLFSRYVNAARFVPMTATTGLFIAWFGIDTNMKIQFLAVGIMVYLIPVIIQRIDEVDSVYDHIAITLGGKKYQRIFFVYIPAVLSKISDDIRVLVAISWTYIIVAEMINSSRGGIGSLAFLCARQSRMDKVFAVLIIIILFGFLQDKLFESLDRKFFKHKYL
jgi:NitT/TauT family transport system permease protein